MSVYHSIQEYIHRYAKDIRVYTSIYFVEVVYVTISQYIVVYIQICNVHMSIYEYILFWSSICLNISQYIGVYTQICKVHSSIYVYILCSSSICSFNPKVCQAFCNISCQYITWYFLYIKDNTQIYVVYHSFYGYVLRCAVFLCAGYHSNHTCGPSLSFLHWRG